MVNAIKKPANYEEEFDYIIRNLYTNANISKIESSVMILVKTQLKAIRNETHPVLNPHDYEKSPRNVPNMGVFTQTNNVSASEGIRFTGNSAILLDLFASQKKFKNNNFILMDDLKRMKLDHLIKPDDVITVSLLNRSTDKKPFNHIPSLKNKNAIDLVNIETFKQLNRYRNGPLLTEKQFNAYFPDFNKQPLMYENMIKRNRNQLFTNTKNPQYQTQVKQIQIDIRNSLLPKLSQELFHSEYCRLTKKTYIPRFSKEEHLKDMIALYKKNPELLKEAVLQSGYIQDKSINRLFSQEMMARTIPLAKQQNQQQNPHPQQQQFTTRVDTMVNHQFVNRVNRSRSVSVSR
jgi:hypothetical protein